MSARLISFDTETTGLDFSTGDRVIEIGCVEIIGREKSGKEFQTYINPEGKEISKEAQEITNISPEQLDEAPKFKDIANNPKEKIDIKKSLGQGCSTKKPINIKKSIENRAIKISFLNRVKALI